MFSQARQLANRLADLLKDGYICEALLVCKFIRCPYECEKMSKSHPFLQHTNCLQSNDTQSGSFPIKCDLEKWIRVGMAELPAEIHPLCS